MTSVDLGAVTHPRDTASCASAASAMKHPAARSAIRSNPDERTFSLLNMMSAHPGIDRPKRQRLGTEPHHSRRPGHYLAFDAQGLWRLGPFGVRWHGGGGP